MNPKAIKKSWGLQSYHSFAELPDDVSQFFRYENIGDFFSSIEWLSCLWRYGYAETPVLRLLTCSGDRPAGESNYLLCLREDMRSRRLNSLTNYYTIHYPGVAAGTVAPDAVFNKIAIEIRDRRPVWSEIELRYLSATDPATAQLCSSFSSAGYRVDLFHQYWNWYVNVEGLSYVDYLAERPARIRNTLRRKAKKLAGKHAVRFEDYFDAEHLATGLADYLDVYERSWKKAEEPPGFVPELIRLCANLGILRLGILYVDDRPIAAQFWICSRQVAFIYKLAHDPQYDDYSVGSLLTAHMFEQAIGNDNVSTIDFGVGDEPYKRDWMNARKQIVGLQAVHRRTLTGCILGVRLGMRDVLRRIGLLKYTAVQPGSAETGHTQAP